MLCPIMLRLLHCTTLKYGDPGVQQVQKSLQGDLLRRWDPIMPKLRMISLLDPRTKQAAFMSLGAQLE